MKREEVYELINKERDYQDRRHPKDASIPAELVMMQIYLTFALNDWAWKEDARHQIRKVVALGIRCLENHGCPERMPNKD